MAPLYKIQNHQTDESSNLAFIRVLRGEKCRKRKIFVQISEIPWKNAKITIFSKCVRSARVYSSCRKQISVPLSSRFVHYNPLKWVKKISQIFAAVKVHLSFLFGFPKLSLCWISIWWDFVDCHHCSADYLWDVVLIERKIREREKSSAKLAQKCFSTSQVMWKKMDKNLPESHEVNAKLVLVNGGESAWRLWNKTFHLSGTEESEPKAKDCVGLWRWKENIDKLFTNFIIDMLFGIKSFLIEGIFVRWH